ncbi:hypothetical protein NX774_00475 [Massilia agilis]|uniref:Uncharacterized protein n=1 Tax=Massilia agilis TaxID=1811226 RepID=A0ABT2D538_9BURK|nr:hypothetical protein [Massilia agilis]MCS0806399.1 hypothetical protein [Massilia agilis]
MATKETKMAIYHNGPASSWLGTGPYRGIRISKQANNIGAANDEAANLRIPLAIVRRRKYLER